ncbi:unnamed protein product, partial [Laminaria digitata]
NRVQVVKRLIKALMDRFPTTDMVDVSLILGMAATRDYEAGTLTIAQTDCAKNILERFGVLDCN